MKIGQGVDAITQITKWGLVDDHEEKESFQETTIADSFRAGELMVCRLLLSGCFHIGVVYIYHFQPALFHYLRDPNCPTTVQFRY